MQRWFLVLAILATSLWAAAVVAAVGGWASRLVLLWSGGAAGATLVAHAWAAIGSGAFEARLGPATEPVWVTVQATKHRRKGIWFAGWGGLAAVLGWAVAWAEAAPSRGSGGLVPLGAAGNLGFQPGLLVAGGFGVVARSRLAGWSLGPVPERAEGGEV